MPSPPAPAPAGPSSPACATSPTTSAGTPPSPSPNTAPRSSCTPPAPTTADCAQVDRFARQLGVPVENELAYSGHYRAARCFGPVGYRMTAISDAAMARHHAHESYHGTSPPTPGPDA